jgi:hypothetical protein
MQVGSAGCCAREAAFRKTAALATPAAPVGFRRHAQPFG